MKVAQHFGAGYRSMIVFPSRRDDRIAPNLFARLFAPDTSPPPLPVLLTTKQEGLLFLAARSSRLCLIPPLQRSTFKDLLDYAASQTFALISPFSDDEFIRPYESTVQRRPSRSVSSWGLLGSIPMLIF
jgi:hypothetical protein